MTDIKSDYEKGLDKMHEWFVIALFNSQIQLSIMENIIKHVNEMRNEK